MDKIIHVDNLLDIAINSGSVWDNICSLIALI